MKKTKEATPKVDPTQERIDAFKAKEYRVGQIFSREGSRAATFTGDAKITEEGIVMFFADGGAFLESQCTLITEDCPEALWAVNKDLELIEKMANRQMQIISEEYKKLKTNEQS